MESKLDEGNVELLKRYERVIESYIAAEKFDHAVEVAKRAA